jgi:hypothetical protein
MKRLAAILFLLCLVQAASASELSVTTITNNVVIDGDSYFIFPFGNPAPSTGDMLPDYLGNYFSTRYPSHYFRVITLGRSGGTDINNLTNIVPLLIAHTGYRTNDNQSLFFNKATENSYVNSNTTYLSFSNAFQAPGIMSSGDSTLSSVSGWSATHSYDKYAMGDFPAQASDGRIGTRGAESDAATNAGVRLGQGSIDLFHPLLGPATNDYNATGGAILWTSDPDHPGPALHLGALLATINQISTNHVISDCMLDWNTVGIVTTNGCTVTSISKNGNTLTWTRHDDHIRFSWDVPNAATGITNDCRPWFLYQPSDGTNWLFGQGITNLPAGNWQLTAGNIPIGIVSSAVLAGDWNMFTNYVHPEWLQSVESLGMYRDKNGAGRASLIPVNGVGVQAWGSALFTFWGMNHRGDQLIADMTANNDTLMSGFDVPIHNQVQPTNIVYTATLTQVVNVTTATMGTVHWGQ